MIVHPLVSHRLLLGHGWVQQYDLNSAYASSRNYGGLTGADPAHDVQLREARRTTATAA
ncbi:MAG: hypothetical protein ACREH8_04840 [Opitutaceae bacterium]